MIRIHIICEGQTEESFVNYLLREPFANQSIALLPSLIGKPGHKGGNLKFERLLSDVRNRLATDQEAYCTTFFDYYGLPATFPGKRVSETLSSVREKANLLCDTLAEKIKAELGENIAKRFIPYVQMYEFEGLLFSDSEAFARSLDSVHLKENFLQIRNTFATPEEINDSPQTAPSKRIKSLIASYEKPLMGTLGALEIGLLKIRKECKLFDAWLSNLESIPPKEI